MISIYTTVPYLFLSSISNTASLFSDDLICGISDNYILFQTLPNLALKPLQ